MFDPVVGKEVKVVVRNWIPPGQIAYMRPSTTFIGQIQKPMDWLSPDEFQMDAGIDSRLGFRSRVIKKDDILALEYLDGTAVEEIEKPKVLPDFTESVLGSKGNEYVVRHVQGKWSCTCTGFGFRGRCKHIKGVQEKCTFG